MKGTLYLIPNTLGNPDTSLTIPGFVSDVALNLKVFIVEDLRTARRYLKKLDSKIDIDSLKFYLLNEHTVSEDIPPMLDDLLAGTSTGVISEAGIPAVADPGASVVKLAHSKGIKVVPLTGPSSILMALMSSGLNGQQFRFIGYLPVKRDERIRKIREIEQVALKQNETQIFIETPYRNGAVFEDILKHCQGSTLLTIALDISMDSEEIKTLAVGEWKKKNPSLHKRPAVFLLGR